MIDQENHVARIRVVLTALSGMPNTQSTKAMGTALETVEADAINLYRRMALLSQSIGESREQVTRLLADDANFRFYDTTLAKIQKAFDAIDLRENSNKYLTVLDQGSMTILDMCENAISKRLTLGNLGPAGLAELAAHLTEAQEEILAADIEPEAKQILTDLLREVEQAVTSYRISGLAGLRRAAERTIGAFALHRPTLEKPVAEGKLKRTMSMLGTLVTTVRNVEYLKGLAEHAPLFVAMLEAHTK